MILLIDNYDSFSYNLVQLLGSIVEDQEIRVVRNDKTSVEEILRWQPTHIILSPGPGYPASAGICEEVIRRLGDQIPMLGVCLGHQAICEVFGAVIAPAPKLMHGKQSNVKVDTTHYIFKNMKDIIPVARYHSLVAVNHTIPDSLQVIARAEEGEVMAVAHRTYPIIGLQFHPESILTPDGEQMMRNFLTTGGEQND